MNKKIKTYIHKCIVMLLALSLEGVGGGLLTSCTDIVNLFDGSPVEFEEGEKVVFTTNVPDVATVSSRAYTPDDALLKGYTTISDDYTLTLKMYEQGNDTPLGTCTYKPVVSEGTNQYDSDGLLQATPAAGETQFYWESNVRKYAFEATAGTETLEVDQSTQAKWLAQDRLHGYAFAPLLDTDNNNLPVDNINALNHHTNKEWGAMNKAWREADAASTSEMHSADDYKQIPLFLQHQRSWITLILKAGNGVSRDALKYETAKKNVSVSFFDYANGQEEPTVLNKPFLKKTTINYEKDKNGEAQTGAETTAFNVIVHPHNYTGDNASKDKIAAISVAGLKFSFYASNDHNYTTADSPSEEQQLAMSAYNLEAGKHLTITATLTTDRIVYITAWIEDWTEVATSTICDDYGQNGDPILITSRKDLIDFLDSETDNKSGNVAIVVANTLDLDKNITTTYYTQAEIDAAKQGDAAYGKTTSDVKSTSESVDPWSNHSNKKLNATLNMAGAKFTTSSQLLDSISSTGSIVNGTIVINNTTPVASAIANVSLGTLERVNVVPAGSAQASKAGLVVTNYGTIYQCTSTLPVYGTAGGYVGGIAAESKSKDGTIMPVIDACTVNAAVKGDANVTTLKGGGIVGLAEGRVTNNTFEYGITLLQPTERFKNIIGAKDDHELRADNNWWPTTTLNELDSDKAKNVNANTDAKYNNVLDCQEELKELLKSTYNKSTYKYRVAADFTVNSDYWKRTIDGTFIGQKHDDINTPDEEVCNGNLYCELDGNGKTITLSGTATVPVPTTEASGKATASENKTTSAMLFSNITGKVHDLTIYLAKPLIAEPSKNNDGVLTSIDAIAPLAYSVRGDKAVISNVKVKMADDAYIQAALPAGIVCWANNNATIEDCQVKGKILSWLPNGYVSNEISGESDAKRYAGGIVGCAALATIKGCIFHSSTNTLTEAKTSGTTIYYGGILGGTAVKDISGVRENPAVSIIDCISWFAPDTSTKGAVVGKASYTNTTDNVNHTGTVTTGDNKCQGNWWNTSYKGVAEKLGTETEETVIGKCSGVTPSVDNKY